VQVSLDYEAKGACSSRRQVLRIYPCQHGNYFLRAVASSLCDVKFQLWFSLRNAEQGGLRAAVLVERLTPFLPGPKQFRSVKLVQHQQGEQVKGVCELSINITPLRDGFLKALRS